MVRSSPLVPVRPRSFVVTAALPAYHRTRPVRVEQLRFPGETLLMRFARCWFTAIVACLLIGAGTAPAADAPAPAQSPQAPRKELKLVILQMNVSATTREKRVAGAL